MRLLLTSLLIALAAGAPPAASGRPPNVIFVLTDDQGPWTLGAVGGPGHTPRLDRLAREGALFRQAFVVSAVCSPARAAMISGRYPSETGILDFIVDNGKNGLDVTLPTWPELLRAGGYATALVGKWHLGHARPEFLPTRRGYDFFSGYPIGGKTSQSPSLEVEGTWKTFDGEFTSDVLTDLAIAYVRRLAAKPFALSLHYWAPHANQGVPAGFTLPYDDRTWLPMKDEDLAPWLGRKVQPPSPLSLHLDVPRYERMMREYLASVQGVDRNVGRLLDVLDELGLAANTIVIFTSDNGYLLGQHALWHKGNGWWLTPGRNDPTGNHGTTRFNLYDESIRVPAVVRWPQRIKPGMVVNQPVTNLDWFPTLLAMTGVTARPDLVLRGQNLLPILEGREQRHDAEVFVQYVHLRGLRTPQWKLVRDLKTGHDELYDLVRDPAEQTNLLPARSEQIATVQRELASRLDARMRAVADSPPPAPARAPKKI